MPALCTRATTITAQQHPFKWLNF